MNIDSARRARFNLNANSQLTLPHLTDNSSALRTHRRSIKCVVSVKRRHSLFTEYPFQFFLKGTQLSQLSDEYEVCVANIRQTAKILDQKGKALPDLLSAAQAAEDRFKEAEKAVELQKKIDKLKNELVWAHVKEKHDVNSFSRPPWA